MTDSRGCRRPVWPRPPPHGHRAGPVPCGPSPASAGSPGDKGTWGHCHIPCLSPTLAIYAPASAGGPGDTGDSPIPVWCPHLCLDVPSPCTHPGDPIPTQEQCPCPHSSVPILHLMFPPPYPCPHNTISLSLSHCFHLSVSFLCPHIPFSVTPILGSLSPSLGHRPHPHSSLYLHVPSLSDPTNAYVVPTMSLVPPDHCRHPSGCS